VLKTVLSAILFSLAPVLFLQNHANENFRFVILGDRTGGAQPGVFEEAIRQADAAHPDFIITAGDAIQGGDDARADSEWRSVAATLERQFHHLPLFLTPGNHDVWSDASAKAFERHAKRPLHYSFDYGQAHFTVLNNSRTEQFDSDELSFLEKDLSSHSSQPLKFVFSHRPSWILQALLGDRRSIYQQLAEKYQIQYFIAGHIHQMLYFRVGRVNYLSVPSAGGHLRGDKRYESGWFFAETQVEVHGGEASFTIHELRKPYGESRISSPADWSAAGLVSHRPATVARP
jgi:3',5'-cyclic-AMP phosphodiesterase